MPAKDTFFEFLRAQAWQRIGAVEWAALRAEFQARSENSLREWLRESGVPTDQPYAGIGTKSLDELEQSLLAMGQLYLSDHTARSVSRSLVIQAKDRARFAASNPRADPRKRALKEEMLQWMLVWLADPSMFPDWVQMRKNSIR